MIRPYDHFCVCDCYLTAFMITPSTIFQHPLEECGPFLSKISYALSSCYTRWTSREQWIKVRVSIIPFDENTGVENNHHVIYGDVSGSLQREPSQIVGPEDSHTQMS